MLIHLLDGYENHEAPWVPADGLRDVSTSFIFGAMRHRDGQNRIPIFGGGGLGLGIIFRPAVTSIRCGNGADAGGHCHPECEWEDMKFDPDIPYPGDGCGGNSWSPQHVGMFLERVNGYHQKRDRSYYNEFIVDGIRWAANMPRTVEAIFEVGGDEGKIEEGRAVIRDMAKAYHFTPERLPLLSFDVTNWEKPFSLTP